MKLLLSWIILVIIFTVFGLFFLKNSYFHWKLLRRQTLELNQQWRQQHLISARFQKTRQDSILLENRYHKKLQLLHHPIYLATLLTDLTALAENEKIQLTNLQPLQTSMSGELQLQTVRLDINGKELQVLNFLHLITQKNWICDFKTLEMSVIPDGVRLQAGLDLYYDSMRIKT